ncbi:MAG: O-antigen ligase family protein [Sphingomonas bacterium]
MYLIKTLIVIEFLLSMGLFLYRAALVPSQRHIVDAKVVGLILLTPAVALLCHNIYIYYAYLMVAVAFNWRSRAELCSIYLLMLPMTPMMSLGGQIGGLYLIQLSTVAVMNIGALIGLFIARRQRAYTRPAFDAAIFLLFAMHVYIDSRGEGAASVTNFARLLIVQGIAICIPYVVVSRALGERRDIDLSLLRLTLAGFLAALIAVFETARNWILYQSFYGALKVQMLAGSATLNMRGGRLRTGGPLLDNTGAGIFFAVVLMILPFLRSRFRPAAFWGVAAIMAAGLFATQSRGAWIAAIVGFGAILVYRGQSSRAALFAGLGGGAAAIVLLTLDKGSRLAETLGVSGRSVGTGEYRSRLLSRGLEQIAAHPLLGQSPQQLVANMSDMVQGQHIVDFVNTHLYIAMAAGLPWFAVWLGIWASASVAAWRLRKAAQPGENAAEVPFAIIVTAMAALVATSPIDRNMTWAIIALALAQPCFALAKARSSPLVRRHRPKLVASIRPARV